MIGFNRIQRYVFREYLAAFLTVLGVISLAIILVDTVEQLRTVGARINISIGTALYLALLKFPKLAEQTMPFAVLAGSIMTFRRLSRRAELPVIRASGLSAWSFLAPVATAALLIGLITMTVVSPMGANLTARFEQTRNQMFNSNIANISKFESGVWLREVNDIGQTIINAASIDETGAVLSDAKFILEARIFEDGEATDRYAFTSRYDAKSARLINGFWQLEDVIENGPGANPQHYDELSLATTLELYTLTDQYSAPDTISFWTLPERIKQTRAAGLRTERHEMRLMGLTALPLVFVVMSLIGSLACLRLARLGGAAPLMAAAMLGAIAFYFINQVSASMASTGTVPPAIAAWLPPLFCLFICLAIIAFREDG